MPPRSLVRAFLVLYVTLGLVILVESVRTVLAAHHGAFSGPDTTHALLLGGLEALAAAAFLILVYASGVLFVRVHGVSGYHWSAVA